MEAKAKVIIIGGGLSGLTLAYQLQKKGIAALVLEASSRLGGRIQTVTGPLGTPLELGATWLGDKHTHLNALLQELGLRKYPQYSKGITLFQTKSFEPPQQFFVPETEYPSYRIAGGTQLLTDTLANKLPAQNIRFHTTVTAVKETGGAITVETADGKAFHADVAVICIPPQLAASGIAFTPGLPSSVRTILPAVQTWMAGSIKFAVEYAEPFWRRKGFSGMLYSHAGIVAEMYDHTNFEEDKYGFTGFLQSGVARYSAQVRKENVLRQLSELLGEEALRPTAYIDKVWNDAFVLHGAPLIEQPHQYNGHPLLQEAYMNGKLLFCGTETASGFPGYMDGAVEAAVSVAEKIA